MIFFISSIEWNKNATVCVYYFFCKLISRLKTNWRWYSTFKCYLLRNVDHINDCIYDFGFGLHFRLILVQRKFASIYDDSLSFDCVCTFLFSLLFLHLFVLYKRSKGLECVLGRMGYYYLQHSIYACPFQFSTNEMK